jgi:hypothetical protein
VGDNYESAAGIDRKALHQPFDRFNTARRRANADDGKQNLCPGHPSAISFLPADGQLTHEMVRKREESLLAGWTGGFLH